MKKARPIIKICGLKSAEMAYQTALAGADHIGLIFHPPSKRYVDLAQAVDIAAAAHAGGSHPVAVFTQHNHQQMLEICQSTNITIVQLHDEPARQHAKRLPTTIERFYVRHVNRQGDIANDPHFNDNNFNKQRDKVLFDNLVAGSGQAINLSTLATTDYDFDFFIAGGISAENILTVINQCQPYGIDLSSGVESSPGEKSFTQIQQVIDLIHQQQEPSC